MGVTSRTYPVPAKLASPLLAGAVTVDRIDALLESGAGSDDLRAWCSKVRSGFVASINQNLLGDAVELPRGVIVETPDADVVIALLRADGSVFRGESWMEEAIEFDDIIPLTTEEVAFTAAALMDGGAGLVLSPSMPIASLTAAQEPAPNAGDSAPMPSGAKTFAVLDEMDSSAVLELLMITPGPAVYRRHDGKWMMDDDWLHKLESIAPPPVQLIAGAQLTSVAQQVDEATKGKPFKKGEDGVAASGLSSVGRLAEMRLEFALLAASVSEKTGGALGGMPANLQRYWLTGRGAAKIRWGTPGAWRRCHRQLSKYMGPFKSKGACTNLSQKLGGHGVATHVGS